MNVSEPFPLVEADSVTVTVGNREILSRVDLEVGPGQIVAVFGPSGVGKTTLLACLGGLQKPTSGRVRIAGQEISAMPARRRARLRLGLIGFVYQHADLLPELSPIENVMLPALLSGWESTHARARAQELIDALEISTAARTSSVSGGEAQRLALARALITNPKVLLADEPTGSLDWDTRDEVLELLYSSVRQAQMAAVVVTHDRVVTSGADRAIELGPRVALT